MLFLPVDETAITTSILFPHKLQWRPMFLEPALAATSVFDFPAIILSSFRFRQPIVRLYKAAMPFVILALVALVAVTYIEPLSTFTLSKEDKAVQTSASDGTSSGTDANNSKTKSKVPMIDVIT